MANELGDPSQFWACDFSLILCTITPQDGILSNRRIITCKSVLVGASLLLSVQEAPGNNKLGEVLDPAVHIFSFRLCATLPRFNRVHASSLRQSLSILDGTFAPGTMGTDTVHIRVGSHAGNV